MMEGLRQYIVSVTAAAILCTVLREIVPSKGSGAALLKLVSGIFLAFVVISPIKGVSILDITDLFDSYSVESDAYISQGQNLSAEATAAIIKERTEAYILDKAAAYSTSLDVNVSVSRDPVPVPESVEIIGNVSPYAKSVLSNLMEKELGIAKEQQTWIGQH